MSLSSQHSLTALFGVIEESKMLERIFQKQGKVEIVQLLEKRKRRTQKYLEYRKFSDSIGTMHGIRAVKISIRFPFVIWITAGKLISYPIRMARIKLAR